MKMKRRLSWVIFVVLFCICWLPNSHAGMDIKTPAWQKVEALGKKNNYAFLFFSDGKTEAGKGTLTTLEEVKQELSNAGKGVRKENREEGKHHLKRIGIVEVTLDDPKEQELIKMFKVKDSPTVLVIAPNGAVTGYFPKPVDKKTLVESLVSLKETEIIKNLQEGRVVFLCLHKDTESHFATIKTDLKAVADNFRGAVNVIYVSSDDKKEEKLREKFEMGLEAETTVFIIVPPGRAVAKLEGTDITKTNLMRALLASCGSGCGSGCR